MTSPHIDGFGIYLGLSTVVEQTRGPFKSPAGIPPVLRKQAPI